MAVVTWEYIHPELEHPSPQTAMRQLGIALVGSAVETALGDADLQLPHEPPDEHLHGNQRAERDHGGLNRRVGPNEDLRLQHEQVHHDEHRDHAARRLHACVDGAL